MSSLRPVLDLLRAAMAPRLSRLLRAWARTLDVMAPAHMHLRIALRLASLERPAR